MRCLSGNVPLARPTNLDTTFLRLIATGVIEGRDTRSVENSCQAP